MVQPDGVVQGPDGIGDDHRGRESGRSDQWHDRRGVHRWEHRVVARVRVRRKGLPVPGRVVGRLRRGETQDDAGLWSRPDDHRERRRQGDARAHPSHDRQGRRVRSRTRDLLDRPAEQRRFARRLSRDRQRAPGADRRPDRRVLRHGRYRRPRNGRVERIRQCRCRHTNRHLRTCHDGRHLRG